MRRRVKKFTMRSSLQHIGAINAELKAARNFLRPFVVHTALRKQRGALELWKTKVAFLHGLEERQRERARVRELRERFAAMQNLRRARRHHRLHVTRRILSGLQRWVAISLRQDTRNHAMTKWRWRTRRTKQSVERNRKLLRSALLTRGLSRLSALIGAPSRRFKKMFLVVGTKLKFSLVYASFYRKTVLERQFSELNRLRYMEVSKGTLLKCLSVDLLLNRPTQWTKGPRTRQKRAVEEWHKASMSARRARSLSYSSHATVFVASQAHQAHAQPALEANSTARHAVNEHGTDEERDGGESSA